MRKLAALGILLVVSCRFCAAETAQWTEARNEHFVVLTDAGEKHARNLLDQFERIRWMFHAQIPDSQADPVEPIIVVAARNTRSFQAFEPPGYLEKGQLKLAGAFLRVYDKNYVLLRLDAAFDHPFAPVYHEYTHFELSGDAEWMPVWLNEGLAEFFQNTEIRDTDVWVGGPSEGNIEYLRGRQLIPLKTLFKIDRNSPYYHEEQKASIFYAESWALTQFLEHADRTEKTYRINDYLDRMRAREDPVAAAEEAFGDLGLLENSLRAYIRAGKYGRFALSSAAARIDSAGLKVRVLKEGEADAVRADVLLAVHREDEARALLQDLLKSDPTNAQAYETLGTLEYRAGHTEASQQGYGEAIRLSSQNYFVYFNFANLAMQDGKAWDRPEIENSLRTAIRLNPRYYPSSEFLATLLSSLDRDEEAFAVLREAEKMAVTPADALKARERLAKLEMSAEERRRLTAKSADVITPAAGPSLVTYDSGPKHPTETPRGPKHVAKGIVRGVQCTYPAIIEFRIDGPGKSVALYSNDYTTIDYTVLGFLPKGNLHPCDELEGIRARVHYVDSSDKTVDGQVIAMELRK